MTETDTAQRQTWERVAIDPTINNLESIGIQLATIETARHVDLKVLNRYYWSGDEPHTTVEWRRPDHQNDLFNPGRPIDDAELLESNLSYENANTAKIMRTEPMPGSKLLVGQDSSGNKYLCIGSLKTRILSGRHSSIRPQAGTKDSFAVHPSHNPNEPDILRLLSDEEKNELRARREHFEWLQEQSDKSTAPKTLLKISDAIIQLSLRHYGLEAVLESGADLKVYTPDNTVHLKRIPEGLDVNIRPILPTPQEHQIVSRASKGTEKILSFTIENPYLSWSVPVAIELATKTKLEKIPHLIDEVTGTIHMPRPGVLAIGSELHFLGPNPEEETPDTRAIATIYRNTQISHDNDYQYAHK